MEIAVKGSTAMNRQLQYMGTDRVISMTSPVENDYIEAAMTIKKIIDLARGKGNMQGLKALGESRRSVIEQATKWGMTGIGELLVDKSADFLSKIIGDSIE